MNDEKSWPAFWLSFAQDDHKTCHVCVIDAPNSSAALMFATLRGLNPGGEVLMFEVPPEVAAELPRNCFLTQVELDASGAKRLGDIDQTVN